MKCSRCRKNEEFKRNLCKLCFCRLFEKKAKRQLHSFIDKKKKIILLDEETYKTKISELMTKLVEAPLDVIKTKKKPKSIKKGEVLLYSLSINDVLKTVLKNMTNGKGVSSENKPSMLAVFTDEECRAYAEIKGIKTLNKKNESDIDIERFIKSFEHVYPETLFAMSNAVREFENGKR